MRRHFFNSAVIANSKMDYYRAQTKKKVYFGKRLPKGYRRDENGVKFVVCQQIVSGQIRADKTFGPKTPR